MPPGPQPARSLREQTQFAQWLLRFPALTVMVFLRRDLGYRLLNPLGLIAVCGFLAVIAILAQADSADASPNDLLIFALSAFLLGLCQRVKRWRELNCGVRQHSYYIGTSPFEFRWLPGFCHRNRRIARFIDPIVCILAGFALVHVSHALAMWLICSGLCLRSFEYVEHQKRRNQDLDLIDGLIMSERQGQTIEQFEESHDTVQQQGATGIPTGTGFDIEEQIQRRKSNFSP